MVTSQTGFNFYNLTPPKNRPANPHEPTGPIPPPPRPSPEEPGRPPVARRYRGRVEAFLPVSHRGGGWGGGYREVINFGKVWGQIFERKPIKLGRGGTHFILYSGIHFV
jgi:hypothetical protein